MRYARVADTQNETEQAGDQRRQPARVLPAIRRAKKEAAARKGRADGDLKSDTRKVGAARPLCENADKAGINPSPLHLLVLRRIETGRFRGRLDMGEAKNGNLASNSVEQKSAENRTDPRKKVRIERPDAIIVRKNSLNPC